MVAECLKIDSEGGGGDLPKFLYRIAYFLVCIIKLSLSGINSSPLYNFDF